MKKTALVLMIITIVSKLFGLLRDVTLSYFYGASNISDAYLISLTISTVFISIIGTGISSGYTPMYTKVESIGGFVAGNRLTNNLVNIILIICTLIMITVLIFTDTIVKVFASGFEGETLYLAIQFTRISIVGIYFTFLIYIFNSFLQIKGHFFITAMIGFPLNAIIIGSIIISSNTNVILLSIGTVLATASQFLLLIPFLYKSGYKHSFSLDIKDESIRNMMKSAVPIVVGMSIVEINTLVDRTLASQIATGGISALSYAYRLNGFVQGLFVSTVAVAIYPIMSKMANKGDLLGVKKSLIEAIAYINLFVIPATVISMIFTEPIIKLLFGRGAFDENAVKLTASALFFYSIGMIGIGLREILSRAFYSLHDTKTPMINATYALILNIILNIILSKFLGIGGLALATSISAIFTTTLLFIKLRKKIGSFGMKTLFKSFTKIVFASICTGYLSYLFYELLKFNVGSSFLLLLTFCFSILVYLIIIYIIKIEEAKEILQIIKKQLKVKTPSK